jgi:hypothetical protein
MTESIHETIARLQRESYEVASAHGWHESDELDENGIPTVRQLLEWCALFHTEVTECEQEKAHLYFEGEKPCGAISELADVAIRLWDAAGRCGFDLCGSNPYVVQKSIRWAIDAITESARVNGVDSYHAPAFMRLALISVFEEAERIGYRLDRFVTVIEQKMAYNRSRSFRHGNKKA